jgi:hypothetical protein
MHFTRTTFSSAKFSLHLILYEWNELTTEFHFWIRLKVKRYYTKTMWCSTLSMALNGTCKQEFNNQLSRKKKIKKKN